MSALFSTSTAKIPLILLECQNSNGKHQVRCFILNVPNSVHSEAVSNPKAIEIVAVDIHIGAGVLFYIRENTVSIIFHLLLIFI